MVSGMKLLFKQDILQDTKLNSELIIIIIVVIHEDNLCLT